MSKYGPDYSLSGLRWPGLAKLIEECGETAHIAGKIVALGSDVYDTGLCERLEHEIADLYAILGMVVQANGLDRKRIREMRVDKSKRYWGRRGDR